MLFKFDVDGNTWVCFFLNVIDMLGNLVDLRHHYNPFDYFFHDVWHFHNLLGRVSYRDKFVFFSDDGLVFGFDFIVDIGLSNQFFLLDDFILEDFYFLDLWNQFLNCDNFFFGCGDFLDLFFVASCMDNLVHKLVNNLVLGNDNWFFGSDLHEPWHFDDLFNNSLYLVDLGNFVLHSHNLILVDRHFY